MKGSHDLAEFSIAITSTIEQALRQINANQNGVVFVVGADGRVVGAVTDGDVRRRLLVNDALGAAIDTCMNRSFVSVPVGTDREKILKLLDHRISTVPMVDEAGRLVDIYSRERFRLEEEREVLSRARAPARISFGGGGTDQTRYFAENGGAVINATIALYAHATLRRRDDRRVIIASHDLRTTVEAESVDALALDGRLDLLAAAVRLIDPPYGFELEVSADFPVGSGLGGSAAVTAAVIGCFNEFRDDRWSRHQMAQMAFQSERLMLSIPGGWQDQYATVFGGFNSMEFTDDSNEVIPVRVDDDTIHELEESLVMVFTGATRTDGEAHARQSESAGASEGSAREAAERQKEITQAMKRQLLRGDLMSYGRLLHDAWQAKLQFGPHLRTARFNEIYEMALANGAVGGKLLGAGGGGFFVFFVPPFQRHKLVDAMERGGYQCRRLNFDLAGLISWKVRVHA